MAKNYVGMNFVYIKPGVFDMGSPEGNEIFSHEKQHKVILTKGFYLQSSEVTVGQWRCFAEAGFRTDAEIEGWTWSHSKKGWKIPGLLPEWTWQKKKGIYWDNPGFYQDDDYPVTCISWNDTRAFIEWLNQKEGIKFRLPTEAEWEYSCRAGTETIYSSGDVITMKHANFHRSMKSKSIRYYLKRQKNTSNEDYPPNSLVDSIGFYLTSKRTRVAGYYPPNLWGLYNMHGNVWEWCEDHCEYDVEKQVIIDNTYTSNIKDPVGDNGTYRILRGGSWFYTKTSCRSSHRRCLTPEYRASGIGFRLALIP